MFDRIAKILKQDCLLDRVTPILVGVSGGTDSLSLLDLLNRQGYSLVAAHLDHGIRPESGKDAQFVQEFVESLGIQAILGVAFVPEYAAEHNLSIEGSARILRYRFLFTHAKSMNIQAVVVAHNADDQVETILMHFLRGAGLDGLRGMSIRTIPNPWSSSIPLLRPFLGVWRDEIDVYCRERGLLPIHDRTNLDTKYFRNRLRHELIPELGTYIPVVKKRLWNMSELLKADHAVLEALSEHAWDAVVECSGDGFVGFNLDLFNCQPISIQRRLVRSAVVDILPEARNIDYALVKRVLDFVTNPTKSQQVDIGFHLKATSDRKTLFIAAWDAALPKNQYPQISEEFVLTIPSERELSPGWVMRAVLLTEMQLAKKDAVANLDPYQAWIDLGDHDPKVIVRTRLSGERYKPFGMGGSTMKVSDLMINLKIPRYARVSWPLICIGEEVAWLPGYRLAHPFRLTKSTKEVAHITLEKV
jgi:tRNA(Ile)-lysidine synthase